MHFLVYACFMRSEEKRSRKKSLCSRLSFVFSGILMPKKRGSVESVMEEMMEFVRQKTKRGHSVRFALSGYAKHIGEPLASVQTQYRKEMPDAAEAEEKGSFDEWQNRSLVAYVLTHLAKGETLRKCAFDLSEGERRQALRRVATYRELLRQNEDLVYDVMMKLFERGIPFYQPYTNRIVKQTFPLSAMVGGCRDELEKIVKEMTLLQSLLQKSELLRVLQAGEFFERAKG